jgi:hypothetical protein
MTEQARGTQEQQAQQEPDLLTRVSQVKPTDTQQQQTDDSEGKFNINDLDKQIETIQDPALKEQMAGLKKSLLRGENQKYQEIATLRKQYETKLAETSNWTPERVKQEMNKPDFVQAAQEVLQTGNPKGSGLTDEQYSALSDAEKAKLNQMEQKVALLEQSNWEAVKAQQDAQLKNKYANYDPTIIDDLTKNLMTGKVKADRESLFKVIDYEPAVKRAYELGLQDKQTQNQEKVSGMSFTTDGRNIPIPTSVEREKGESIDNWIRRSYAHHTAKK